MKRELAVAFSLMVLALVASGCSTVLGSRTAGTAPAASSQQDSKESLQDFNAWHQQAHRPGGS